MGRKKLTFKYVYNYFKDHGCKLLETEYKNNKTLMKYECNCGNKKINYISFGSFKQGRRCKKCGYKKVAAKRKHTFKFVYNYFKERDCKLLETEYIGVHTKMKYRCNCGNPSICKISFGNFQQGQRCMKCGGREKPTFEFVQRYFEDRDCELFETEYKNCDTPMKYRCKCGNKKCKITFYNFKKGQKCTECAGNKKYTLEEVKQYFKDHDCKLLATEYINVNTPMEYECNCENKKCKICFKSFKKGHRCKKCAIERREQTMLKKYGVLSVNNGGGGHSKESQKLFDIVYKKIDKKYKDKTYYATLNKEFAIKYNNKSFKYDFVNSILKKAIEYNGIVFHPQPHQKDDEIGWFAFDKNKTVKEARNYEKIKYKNLEERGYKILTVWDYELHKDFDTLVKKCLDFLLK